MIQICIFSAMRCVHNLKIWKERASTRGPQIFSLVFSQLHTGGIGRCMLDPVWHSDAEAVNVQLSIVWVYGKGPSWVWSAIKDIKKGILRMVQQFQPVSCPVVTMSVDLYTACMSGTSKSALQFGCCFLSHLCTTVVFTERPMLVFQNAALSPTDFMQVNLCNVHGEMSVGQTCIASRRCMKQRLLCVRSYGCAD